jgi:hypothetical protein
MFSIIRFQHFFQQDIVAPHPAAGNICSVYRGQTIFALACSNWHGMCQGSLQSFGSKDGVCKDWNDTVSFISEPACLMACEVRISGGQVQASVKCQTRASSYCLTSHVPLQRIIQFGCSQKVGRKLDFRYTVKF